MRRLMLELPAETLQLLEVLDERGDAEAAVRELLTRVVDGVRRPGSWERGWLCQAVGREWTERLELDPAAAHLQRPRRRPPSSL